MSATMAVTSAPPTPAPPTPQAISPAPPTNVKIYNAVYSSVQVYECMVRGIAVMRRRSDSYVNATQVLKVAGVEKGRRTKILEKEILPGKHEIVQGGYGKYQGTWIPLERGRELAAQYGVTGLLAPLFDFIPNTNSTILPTVRPMTPGRPGSASPFPFQYNPVLHSTPLPPPVGSPTPIMPGSALKLLNQGRAQGLFTPSTSSLPTLSPGASFPNLPRSPAPRPPQPSSPAPSGMKRVRSEAGGPTPFSPSVNGSPLLDRDVVMQDGTGNGRAMEPPPSKRPRTDTEAQPPDDPRRPPPAAPSPPPQPVYVNGKQVNGTYFDPTPKFATKGPTHRNIERSSFLRNPKRAAVLAAIQGGEDDAQQVLNALKIAGESPLEGAQPDLDIVLDDQGHTALHLASSLGRLPLAKLLVESGADIRRGSFSGETALMRTVLSTHAFDNHSFNSIVAILHPSIRTLDNSRRTVLHHITHVAGVRGRSPAARYYLECILMWIAQREEGDFKSIIDLQDEHGDTALNIAARIGNRSLVKTLIDVGANRILPNKLGLRPGDFGVEGENLLDPSPADMVATLRSSSVPPAQKSEEVIRDITTLITTLKQEFETEIKEKQEALEKARETLRAKTRQLADQRRQVQIWRSHCNELEQVQQRIRNVKRAIAEEDDFDWTGRSEWDGTPTTVEIAGEAFEHKGVNSTLAALEVTNIPLEMSPSGTSVDADPSMPLSDSPASLIKLRRMLMWHKRIDQLMQDRLKAVQGASAERELQCKKIISMSTGLPVEQVESMTSSLLIALESDPQTVDMDRISSFMQKVRESDKAKESTAR